MFPLFLGGFRGGRGGGRGFRGGRGGGGGFRGKYEKNTFKWLKF